MNSCCELETEREAIEKTLDELIPNTDSACKQLFESARYAVLGGGKRLRPILTLLITKMLGGDIQTALLPACTIEIIHAYSLIHDDLPCMDNDDFRRGKPTVHKQYGESLAILTGDYLLTYAFEILAKAPDISASAKIELVTTLAHYSGSDGMIGGQVMDLAFEGKKISLDTLHLLHRSKTAALITAAIEFGSIIAGATVKQRELLRSFGENIGLAFQIIDDILDVTSSEIKHGKKISSDMIHEKCTYVSLLGLDQARVHANNHYEKAIGCINELQLDSSAIEQLGSFIINRTH